MPRDRMFAAHFLGKSGDWTQSKLPRPFGGKSVAADPSGNTVEFA